MHWLPFQLAANVKSFGFCSMTSRCFINDCAKSTCVVSRLQVIWQAAA